MPFYPQGILGCIQHRGQIIPLVSLSHLLLGKPRLGKEKLKVVRLSQNTGNLKGIGIVVDQLLGSQGSDQIPPELKKTGNLPNHSPITVNQEKMWLFQPLVLSEELWQPQHWQLSVS